MTVVAAVACWTLVHHLPEKQADAETTHSGRPQEVQSVALDGHGNLPIAALREVLSTRVGEQIDNAKLAHDREALESVLVAHGYLDAKVKPAEVMFDAGSSAFVMFQISQGRLFHVRSVTVSGATLRDSGVVTMAKGDVVMAERFERARAALADRLVARGKSGAVSVKLHTDESAAAVDVELSAR
jgi:outer membrane protein assembly factor BamA